MSSKVFVLSTLLLCFSGIRDLWSLTDVSAVLHGGLTPQSFAKSVMDTNLMFEFLLNGMEIDSDNNIIMHDQELASMRLGRAFLANLNDNVPKTVPDMEKLLAALDDKHKPLSQAGFETLVLGIVYSAHQAKTQKLEEEREAWGNILFHLANATLLQLRKF